LFKKILKGLFTMIGMTLGYLVGEMLLKSDSISIANNFKGNGALGVLFLLISIVTFGLILFLLSPWIYRVISRAMDYIERNFQKIPASEVIWGTAGAIIGLIISSLVVMPLNRLSIVLGTIVPLVINVFMATLCANIAIRKREDLTAFFSNFKKASSTKDKKNKGNSKGDFKVLDTSVIIDGRIFDICQTEFVEGTLVIPNFVLEELRHIADSSDALKRNRGRRGLDILNRIQKELNIDVQIYEKDFPELAEVDSKLLKLAQVLNGKVITNDYNLNKVAEFQGVPVLNINELANAIKPVVLPGEEMRIQIVKDGKESGQGVAYLDDGTMIVVEGGRKHIGEIIDVIVTSVLQTAAGRMIFAKERELVGE